MPLLASESSDTLCITLEIRPLTFSISLPVVSLNFLISSATTANPFPLSPALAASIEALRDRRFVWDAISLIALETSAICSIIFVPSIAASSLLLLSLVTEIASFLLLIISGTIFSTLEIISPALWVIVSAFLLKSSIWSDTLLHVSLMSLIESVCSDTLAPVSSIAAPISIMFSFI